MLPEDANTALNRMLNAGYKTGAIKMDRKWGSVMEKVVEANEAGRTVDVSRLATEALAK